MQVSLIFEIPDHERRVHYSMLGLSETIKLACENEGSVRMWFYHNFSKVETEELMLTSPNSQDLRDLITVFEGFFNA